MSKRKGRRDPGKEAFWRSVIEEQAASGSSLRAFCREHEISEGSFHYWRKELRRRREEASSDKAQVGDDDVVTAAPAFAEVRLPESPEVEITRGATTIRIRGGCDATLLREAVRVLEDASC